MAEDRNITITRVWRHQSENVVAVYYIEDNEEKHVKDSKRGPDPKLDQALDRLVPNLAGGHYLLPESHHGKVRTRDVRLFVAGGVEQVKLYAQLRPFPDDPDAKDERVPMRSPKLDCRGDLLRAVNVLKKHAIAYVEGERGNELLTDGAEDDEE